MGMTNAEAREHLKDILCDVPNDKCIDWIDALKTAIQALEQQTCEDCISRQAVIKHICESKECYKDECKGRLYKRCYDLQWIYALPSVTPKFTDAEIQKMQELEQAQLEKAYELGAEQTRWIPVSERLPKAGEYVGDVAKYYLVQNEFGDMMVARFTHSEYWEQIYQLKPIADKIVAWMSLPEPYKESEE